MKRKEAESNLSIVQPNSILMDIDILLESEKTIKWRKPPAKDEIKQLSYLVENLILLDKIYVPIMRSDRSTENNLNKLANSTILNKIYKETGTQFLILIAENPEKLPFIGVIPLSDLGLKSFDSFSNFLSIKYFRTLGDRSILFHKDRICLEVFKEMIQDDELYRKRLTDQPGTSNTDMDKIVKDYIANELYGIPKDYFNIELSKFMGISYQPRPESGLLYLADSLYEAGVIASFSQFTAQWMSNLRDELIKSRFEGHESAFFELNIPLLFAVVLRESKTIDKCLDVVLQIRNLDSVVKYRKWATGISSDLRNNSGKKLSDAKRELDNLSNLIKKELGIKSEKFEITLWLFSIPGRIPAKLHRSLWIRPHLRFLRDTALRSFEILRIERELRRVLGAE